MTQMIVDIAPLLVRQRLGRYHFVLIGLCAAACFVSGFALVLPGYLAPQLVASFALRPSALAPIFAAAGLGNVLGELICAPLADRFGRKPMIVGGMFFAVPFLLLTAWATTPLEIMLLQFFALFGLMGLVPNALALAGEFVPRAMKVTLTMLVWLGFEFGAIVAGPVTAYVSAAHGWRPLFLISGATAIAVVLLLAFALPESLGILVKRSNAGREIARTLRHLDPQIVLPSEASFITSEKKEAGFPVSLLFQEGRTRLTILLWIMFFTNMLALFFVNSWLPTVLHTAGLEEGLAVILTAAVHFGGILGGLAIAGLCDRYDSRKFYVLGTAYALSSLSIAAIGFSGSAVGLVAIAAFMVGFFTFGVQNAANGLAATIYPASIRSTGAGWAIGIGNSAQIVAPLFGGYLLSLAWPPRDVLYIVALPAAAAAVAALILAIPLVRTKVQCGDLAGV